MSGKESPKPSPPPPKPDDRLIELVEKMEKPPKKE
jgi:hypothetical protein